MKHKVIGIYISQGEYKDNPYKKLVINVTRKDDKTEGLRAEQYKIKYADLNDALNLNMAQTEVEKLLPKDFANLIGKEVDFFYDQWKNVKSVIIFDTPKSS